MEEVFCIRIILIFNFVLEGPEIMTTKQPAWNKYEAAILLDGFLSFIDGNVSRNDVIKRISVNLRRMAVLEGIEIDETYRNEIGISFQMYSMESAYYGRTIMKPASSLFKEIANLYHESRDDFNSLLREAFMMLNKSQSIEKHFMEYLSMKVSPAQLSELYLCYIEINDYFIKKKKLKQPLFQTTDLDVIKKIRHTIELDIYFKVTHKKNYNAIVSAIRHYYSYVEKGLFPQVEQTSVTLDKANIEKNKSTKVNNEVDLNPENIDNQITYSNADERLQKKYPVVYKRLYDALKANENLMGTTIKELDRAIDHIARPAVIEEILDNVSWTQINGLYYSFFEKKDGGTGSDEKEIASISDKEKNADYSIDSDEKSVLKEKLSLNLKETQSEIKEKKPIVADKEIYEINFTEKFEIAFTKPLSFSYFCETKPCGDSWTDLYLIFLAVVYEDYPHLFAPGMSFSKSSRKIELASINDYGFMRLPKRILGTDFMAETDFSANSLVSRMKYILDLCNIDYENVVITYMKKYNDPQVDAVGISQDSSLPNVYKKSILEDFFNYLTDDLGLSDSECHSCVSAIRFSESFAKDHHFDSWKLNTNNYDEVKSTIHLLLGNSKFKKYNERQNERFRIALAKYHYYIKEKYGKKAPIQVHADFTRPDYHKDHDTPKQINDSGVEKTPIKQKIEHSVSNLNFEDYKLNQKNILYSKSYNPVRESFFYYLSVNTNLSVRTCKDYISAICYSEEFAKKLHISSWEIFTDNYDEAYNTIKLLVNNTEFLAINASENNCIKNALEKYLVFIGKDLITSAPSIPPQEVDDKLYISVLKQHFFKGFRMDSPLEIRKFRKYYEAIHNKELNDSDDALIGIIKNCCVLYDGKSFLPEVMLDDEIKEKLLKYINDLFTSGTSVIYYQAIYDKFSEEFLDSRIHNTDMLRIYLDAVGHGKIYNHNTYMSNKPHVNFNPWKEVDSCLLEYGRPVQIEEIEGKLPHYSEAKIKSVINTSKQIICNGPRIYFHESIVKISDKDLLDITEIIKQNIADKGFISGNELYDVIKIKFPCIVEDNPEISVIGIRNLLGFKLDGSFSFKGNIISPLDKELSMPEVFSDFAINHEKFTLTELQFLAKELKTIIHFDSIYKNSLRISEDDFVSKSSVNFAVSEIDEVLDLICTEKYVPIKDVSNFAIFPYVGFTWNEYLLEQYVAAYSRKYMLLHNGFSASGCFGAIVKRVAKINSFEDLIIDILVENNINLKKESVLHFLVDNGYLARRQYGEIEKVIIKASAQRAGKDAN